MGLGDFKFSWENIGSPALWVPASFFLGFLTKNFTNIYKDFTDWWKRWRGFTHRLNDPELNIIYHTNSPLVDRINPYWVHLDAEYGLHIRGYEQHSLVIVQAYDEDELFNGMYLDDVLKNARQSKMWLNFDSDWQGTNPAGGTTIRLAGLTAALGRELIRESRWSKGWKRRTDRDKKRRFREFKSRLGTVAEKVGKDQP